MADDPPPPTDRELLSTVWVFPEFLQAVGPLHEGNVLEYFSHSPFFDRQSTNQQLKMQTIHTGQPVLDEAEELRRFTGIEFALVHARPPALFLIHKRERHSPEHTTTLASYSVINNNVYLSPTLDGVLASRLTTAVDALHASMNTLRDRLAKEASFDPRGESQVVLTRQAPVANAPSSVVVEGSSSAPATAAAATTATVNVQPSLTALRSALAVLPTLNRQSSTAPPSLAVSSAVDLARLGGSAARAAAAGGGSSNAGTPTPGGPGTGRSAGMVPTPPPTTGKSTGGGGGGGGTPGSAGPSGLGAGGGGGGGKSKKKKRKLEADGGGGGPSRKDEGGTTSSPFTTTPVGV